MAIYRIIAWRGIPATVEAHDAADNVSRPLSERFQMLIDSVAMQFGLAGSDEYLEQWSGGEEQERAGAALEVADAVAAELEARFPEFVAGAFRTA